MSEKVSFSLPCLEALVATENSCVYCKRSCKRSLVLLPIHLSNFKVSIKEMLKSTVTTYDLELDGIILSHKNIKLISCVHFNDEGKFKIDYQADIYIFKPSVGSILTGQVNKKSRDIIGCLVHSVFNVAIPQKDGKKWLGHNVRLGQTVTFNVVKLDFTSSLPYIKGELISVESAERDEGVDSGVQEIDYEICPKVKKIGQGEDSKKLALPARCSQKHKLSDSDEDVFVNKKIKKVCTMADKFPPDLAYQDENVTKRRKKHTLKPTLENQESDVVLPLTVQNNFNEDKLDSLSTHSPRKKKKKHEKEETSVTEFQNVEGLETSIIEKTPKKKKKHSHLVQTKLDYIIKTKEFHNTSKDRDDKDKTEMEESFAKDIKNFEDLNNKFATNNELSAAELGEDTKSKKKKKHKKHELSAIDLQTSFDNKNELTETGLNVSIKKKKNKRVSENEIYNAAVSESTQPINEMGDKLIEDTTPFVEGVNVGNKKKKHKKSRDNLSNIETATSLEDIKNKLLEEVKATVSEQENNAGDKEKKKKKKKKSEPEMNVSGAVETSLLEGKATVNEQENNAGDKEKKKKKKKKSELEMNVSGVVETRLLEEGSEQENNEKKKNKEIGMTETSLSVEEVKKKLLWEAKATISEQENNAGEKKKKKKKQTEMDDNVQVKNLFPGEAPVDKQENAQKKKKIKKSMEETKISLEEVKNRLLGEAAATVNKENNAGQAEDIDLQVVKNKLLAEAKASVSEQDTDVEKTKKRKKNVSMKTEKADPSEIKDKLLAEVEASVNEHSMKKKLNQGNTVSDHSEAEKEFVSESVVSTMEKRKEKHKKQKGNVLNDKGQNCLDDIRSQLIAEAKASFKEQLVSLDQRKQEVQANADGENDQLAQENVHKKKKKHKDKNSEIQLQPLDEVRSKLLAQAQASLGEEALTEKKHKKKKQKVHSQHTD
ncbi:eukaryotic translation initiation factor 5B [Cimex lectularius]|uniref:DNA-directed RNA polymerase I subunit RPA43 n=1 Tax=Cimex lectularius TaxID=79782 RepID=A0A8I6TKM6_CIMLE|nr:eukaryotic translation initiation factor 5B [Cimex lectularius]